MLLGTFHRLEPIISARIKLTGSPFSELAIALFINQSVVPFRSVRFCPKFKKEVLRPDSEALLFFGKVVDKNSLVVIQKLKAA